MTPALRAGASVTYEVKRTRGGRHYVIAWDGDRKIYVTRQAHTSAEPALVEARNYINGTPETNPEAEPERVSFWQAMARKLQMGA